jgi:choline-sulfatase
MTVHRPNLLVIQADQLKPQMLPFHGGPALMPNLERLATEGVVFDNAYCNFPLCAPSRFSMLAGMLPSRVQAYDNAAEFPAQIPTVAHYLRLAGYHTVLAGKQHFVGPDMLHGFHQRLVPELYPTDFQWTPRWGEVRMDSNSDATGVTRSGVCVRSMQMDFDEAVAYRANAVLHDVARDARRRPFFLFASFTHPHEPYYAGQRWWDRYRHDDIAMPKTSLLPEAQRDAHSQRMLMQHGLINGDITDAHVRIARHGYLANCSYFDDKVGELLGTLADTGLADDTVIVITSDHGDMLGERGMWFKKHFFDHAARVPLLVHSPRRFTPGRRAENVSLVDFMPTLCELGGVDLAARAPEPPDGCSLVGACAGQSFDADRPVFGEITSEGVPGPMFMVKRGRHKLMTGGGASDLLFDLEQDPQELTDLSHVPAVSSTLASLKALAATTWDSQALEQEIRLSQRRRRLVQSAHVGNGPAPVWDHDVGDPVIASCHRGPEIYNDWAWQGIEDGPG